jgi:PBP1b-binding outer membrane lipoprotein LpoB
MEKIFTTTLLLSILFLSGCNNKPAVKKSTTGICHEKGTTFYNNTKNFISYNSTQECLDSGARLPKK